MIRTLTGFAVFAVIGIAAFKVVFSIVGFAFSLLWSLLWLAAIGFVIYLILKIVSPETARRIREKIEGKSKKSED